MKRKEGFVLREVCGEKVIVGEGLGAIDFGKLLSINETAAWLWNEAGRQVDFSVDSLVEAICEEYDVDLETARTDVDTLLTQWKEVRPLDLAGDAGDSMEHPRTHRRRHRAGCPRPVDGMALPSFHRCDHPHGHV